MAKDDSIPSLDRDRVFAQAELLDRDDLLIWIGKALDRLDDDAIAWMIEEHVRIEDVRNEPSPPADFLAKIRAFHEDAIDGDYYESFRVNSRNFMEKSRGTENFIAAHALHLGRCVRAVDTGKLDAAREGFELLVDLVRRIDDDPDAIVFFADEGGSWQLGVDWDTVIAAWARTIASYDPQSWADYVTEQCQYIEYFERERAPAKFRKHGTSAQVAALRRRDK